MQTTHGDLSIANFAPGMLALPGGFAIAACSGTLAAYTELMVLHAAPPENQCSPSPLCPQLRSVLHHWVASWAHNGLTPLRMSPSASQLAPAWERVAAMVPSVIWLCRPVPPKRKLSCHLHALSLCCLTMWAEAVGPRLPCGVPFSELMRDAWTDPQPPAMLGTPKLALKLTGTALAAMGTKATAPKGTPRPLLVC